MLARQIYRLHDPNFINYIHNIRKYNNTVINPSLINFTDNNKIDIQNNTWFSTCEYPYNFQYVYQLPFDLSKKEKGTIDFKTIKINMYPNDFQKHILDCWFNSFNIGYNNTIMFLRKHLPYGTIKRYKFIHDKYVSVRIYEKKIVTLKQAITTLQRKYDAAITKLDKLYLIVDKNKKIYKNIVKCKQTLHGINLELKNKNIELHKEYNKLNPIVKYKNEYLSLNNHISYYLNYNRIRTDYLIDMKQNIIDNYSCYKQNTDYKIPAHTIDGAIKKACANYKTCIDNLIHNRIKRFRIKCRNLAKDNKIMEIEGQYFNNDNGHYTICKKILGNMDYKYNKKPYILTTKHTSNILFKDRKYMLLLTVPITKTDLVKKSFACCDPGARTFVTVFTPDNITKYGNNVTEKLIEYFKKQDKLNNQNNTIDTEINRCLLTVKKYHNILLNNNNTSKKKIKIQKAITINEKRIEHLKKIKENPKQKEKYEKYMMYRKKQKSNHYDKKMTNMVNELHWKITKELAENYEIVVIGKIGNQSILQQNKLGSMTKRVLQKLSHYTFRERLVYKCLVSNTSIIIQNEAYTTKTCLICGKFNGNITTEKEIICEKCHNKFNRDGSSSIGIGIKSFH